MKYQYIIVGSGIVGMSVAYELLQKQARAKIAILEKEADIGVHASGRNSGVLHSGIFYRVVDPKNETMIKYRP